MKILQIVPGFTIGGPTYSVSAVTKHIQSLGHEIPIFLHDDSLDGYENLNLDFRKFRLNHFPFNKQLAYSRQLKELLKKESENANIIQTNSLWQYPNFVINNINKSNNRKIVIVPRGTLSSYALSLSSWKKKLVLFLGQMKALKIADLFIATCQKEYEDIRAFGLKQPVAIIPNGVEIPELTDITKKKQILFLGRIHKVKGVDILIKAWKLLENDPKFSEWQLKIAGPLKSDYAQQMVKQAEDLERIEFVGEKFGEDKNRLMAESSIYVLPTHTENFGLSIAESLACGTPVITTTGAPWKGLIENNCGRWIDLSIDNLVSSLKELASKEIDELIKMGKNGKEWINEDFSWPEIAKRTISTYEWLLNPKENTKPEWVILN